METSQEYNYFELKNGIRIIHKYSNTPIVHIGLFINAGSRDETFSEKGIAHFIEHVIFKGTKNRRSYQIFNSIENVGGELNAYTAKEETVIHCSVPKENFEKAAEIISDVVFNSIFPEKELEKEKDIIIDEYYYYKDIPEEVILDDFDELVYKNHPLGWNILGEPSRVKQFTKKDIETFIYNNYLPEKMVVSVVGAIDETIVFRVIKKFFEIKEYLHGAPQKRVAFNKFKPVKKQYDKKIFQTHCVMGRLAYPMFDKRRLGLVLLNNLLGGPASNAWLNMAVREKHGLTYNIESGYSSFTDSGLFRIYVSSENDSMEKTIGIINNVLKKLKENKLGTLQLSRAKQQLIGNLALSYESKISEMLSIGKTYMIFNKVDSIEEINDKIMRITAGELYDIANEIFDTDRFSQLIYKSNESYRAEDN